MHLCGLQKLLLYKRRQFYSLIYNFYKLHSSECIYRLHLCGSARRIYAEEYADCGRESDCDNYCRELHFNRYIHIARNRKRSDRAQNQSYQSAEQTQDYRLGQKLEQDC